MTLDALPQARLDPVPGLTAVRVHQRCRHHGVAAQGAGQPLQVGLVVFGDADEVEARDIEAPQVLR